MLSGHAPYVLTTSKLVVERKTGHSYRWCFSSCNSFTSTDPGPNAKHRNPPIPLAGITHRLGLDEGRGHDGDPPRQDHTGPCAVVLSGQGPPRNGHRAFSPSRCGPNVQGSCCQYIGPRAVRPFHIRPLLVGGHDASMITMMMVVSLTPRQDITTTIPRLVHQMVSQAQDKTRRRRCSKYQHQRLLDRQQGKRTVSDGLLSWWWLRHHRHGATPQDGDEFCQVG